MVQPLVLLVDKANLATELDGIAAVAKASVLALHSLPGDWDEWLEGAFTKSVRRADLKTFHKLLDDASLAHVTASHRGASAIAYAPMDNQSLPPALKRLQVSGTQLPASALGHETSAARILLNESLGMSTGKAAAQAAHSWMLAYLDGAITVDDFPSIRWASKEELDNRAQGNLTAVRDAGRTEIPAQSLTAVTVLSLNDNKHKADHR